MTERRTSHYTMIMTYITFSLLILIGHIRDQLGMIFLPWYYRSFYESSKIPALRTRYESFFVRRLYRRICDCWNRPITGQPGRNINILERISTDQNNTFRLSGREVKALNTGSYNYLGFTEMPSNTQDALLETVDRYGANVAYPAGDHQAHTLAREVEQEIAAFLQREDCIVFPMGYGTNTWTMSVLMTDSLIFSDENNHTSLIVGMKLASSHVVVFKHNDMVDLEDKLIESISQGHPTTHRAWSRIFVVVEGIYSMEGTMVDLVKLVELKKKYKFYIYVDEAHSIGAIGYTGRGICEHKGVDFSDVDILMGTFSKSFVAAGGYIAGSAKLVNYLRAVSDGALFSEQIPPVVCMQILLCLRHIQEDKSRIRRLASNASIIRARLKQLNFSVLGDEGSPVVPILIYSPGKIAEFSRLCLALGVAVIVVGYPATPILLSRVRLCMSAHHTTEDIERIVEVIDRIGTIMGMRG